jgi:hypothetical protein
MVVVAPSKIHAVAAVTHRFFQSGGRIGPPQLLSSEQVEYERKYQAEQDAGGDGHVNPETLPAETQITRKAAEGDLVGQQEQQTQGGKDRARSDQKLSHENPVHIFS